MTTEDVIGAVEDAVLDLIADCSPGGGCCSLDRVLAADVALRARRLMESLARLRSRCDGVPAGVAGVTIPIGLRWARDDGQAAALGKDGWLYERGLTGPWVRSRECKTEAAACDHLARLGGRWRRVNNTE